MTGLRACQSHGWCRYWDGSERKRRGLPGENVLEPAGLRLHPEVETSELQSGQGQCLRPCRPHPCRHRQVSRRRGSARWFGRSQDEHIRSQPEASQCRGNANFECRFDYPTLISMQVTSSCCGVVPTKKSRSAIRRCRSSSGVAMIPFCNTLSSRDSSYSSPFALSASTTPSVKITSQSPDCKVTVPDS